MRQDMSAVARSPLAALDSGTSLPLPAFSLNASASAIPSETEKGGETATIAANPANARTLDKEKLIIDTFTQLYSKSGFEYNEAAKDKIAAIKAKESWRNKLKTSGPIYLALGLGVLISFFTASPVALPWILLGFSILAATNYSFHSIDWQRSAGRGIAMVISLATGMLTMVSVMNVLGWAFPAALIIGIGAFVTNLILYRTSVPGVVKEAYESLKQPVIKLRDFIKNLYKTHILRQPLPVNEKDDEKDKKVEKSALRVYGKQAASLLSAAISLMTGYILTAGLMSSWKAGMDAILVGLLHISSSAAGLAVGPFVVYPLIAIIFFANFAFVKRGVDSAFQFIYEVGCLSLYGLDAKGAVKEQAPKGEYAPGLQAIGRYFFGVTKDDKAGKTFLKVSVRLVLVAAILAVAIISQHALVAGYMQFTPALIPVFKAVMVPGLMIVFQYAGYLARISMVALQATTNVLNFGSWLGARLEPVWLYITGNQAKLKGYTKIEASTAAEAEIMTDAKVNASTDKQAEESPLNFWDRVKNRALLLTQDFDNIHEWYPAAATAPDKWKAKDLIEGPFGENWRPYFDLQCQLDWEAASPARRNWYKFVALCQIVLEYCYIPLAAIVTGVGLNTVGNAAIASQKLPLDVDKFILPVGATAPAGGLGSLVLVSNSARIARSLPENADDLDRVQLRNKQAAKEEAAARLAEEAAQMAKVPPSKAERITIMAADTGLLTTAAETFPDNHVLSQASPRSVSRAGELVAAEDVAPPTAAQKSPVSRLPSDLSLATATSGADVAVDIEGSPERSGSSDTTATMGAAAIVPPGGLNTTGAANLGVLVSPDAGARAERKRGIFSPGRSDLIGVGIFSPGGDSTVIMGDSPQQAKDALPPTPAVHRGKFWMSNTTNGKGVAPVPEGDEGSSPLMSPGAASEEDFPFMPRGTASQGRRRGE